MPKIQDGEKSVEWFGGLAKEYLTNQGIFIIT
jgi:hypothetical protein